MGFEDGSDILHQAVAGVFTVMCDGRAFGYVTAEAPLSSSWKAFRDRRPQCRGS